MVLVADIHIDAQSPSTPVPPTANSAKSPDAEPLGMSAFPDITGADAAASSGPNVRVTGASGLGEDEDMEKFESAFPDLSGEVSREAVSCGCILLIVVLVSVSSGIICLALNQGWRMAWGSIASTSPVPCGAV